MPNKINNPTTHNNDIIQTYYFGKETSIKNDDKIYPAKKRLFLYQIIFITASIIIFSMAIWYYLYPKKTDMADMNVDTKETAISLIPLRTYNNISYYDYKRIEGNASPVMLYTQSKSAVIKLQKASDLRNAVLFFEAKGISGTEKIAIILKDKYNRSNANKRDAIMTSVLNKDDWQAFKIKLSDLNLPLDKSQVTQVRFDTSDYLTGKNPNITVYIKNIHMEFNNGGNIL